MLSWLIKLFLVGNSIPPYNRAECRMGDRQCAVLKASCSICLVSVTPNACVCFGSQFKAAALMFSETALCED